MEDSFLVIVIFVILTFPIMAIVALVKAVNLRQRLDMVTDELRYKQSDLIGEIARLRRELDELSKRMEGGEKAKPATVAAPATPLAAPPVVKPAPEVQPQAVVVTAPPPVQPMVVRPAPAAPAPPAVPVAVPPAPPEQKPAPATPAPARVPVSVAVPPAPAAVPVSRPPMPVPPPRPTPPVFVPTFATQPPQPPRKPIGDWLKTTLPLEELLGLNVASKIGIILLVLGLGFFGQLAFVSMGPGARSAVILSVGAALLGGGVFLERKERYKIVGRGGIGGGWAVLFFVAYAIHHIPAMAVIQSNTLDCILMLIVAAAMVAHTLRYRSQVVTGLAFLLAFSTVALSQDSVYALAAGVILALSIVAITLRMKWFELETFGILASYANHFYWLWKLYPDGVAGHAFPQFWPSVIILALYWLVFRLSYVFRRIERAGQEKVSTIAALLNTMLLGVVMKFQSIHPELAFYALLALGLLEFAFGQLPVTRRRRPAFVLLTILGTLLVFTAVPFRFSGNNIAFFWMIAAEALLAAGIVQSEVLFRRLGLLAGVVTGALVIYEARGIVDFRQHSDAVMAANGVLLFSCAALFYLNSLWMRARWQRFFGEFDNGLATAQCYLGAVTAFLGVWALAPGDWTAVGWAAMMVAAAFGVRRLGNLHLLIQSALTALIAAITALSFNCHWTVVYPHHLTLRLATLPLLALLFYATNALLKTEDLHQLGVRTFALWSGSGMLALLIWLELNPVWAAPAWMALAVTLVLIARRLRLNDLAFQEHALVLASAVQLLTTNLDAETSVARYAPLLLCAAALYAISRFSTLAEAVYRRPAAWAHTWIATALLAALAWHESPQPWLAPLWAGFALALALIDRWHNAEELPWQAHLLALMAVLRAVSLNLFDTEVWRGLDRRLLTVSILIAVLYTLARWVRLPGQSRARGIQHIYTWGASALLAWLIWAELQPVAVAVGLALFGLVLFEFGDRPKLQQIRLQGYVALTAAFARIFFVNLTAATLPGERIGPRIFTVVPIAVILFYVWAQLEARTEQGKIRTWSPRDLFAYFGAGSIVALIYFELASEWIIVAWAIVVLALLAVGFLLRKEVFLQQAALLTVGITIRGLAHNIFGGSYFSESGWRGNFLVPALASLLLLSGLPIAFAVRRRFAADPPVFRPTRMLWAHRVDQHLFFSPLLLVGLVIMVKMNPGMVTLSWGVEGLIAIALGLLLSQRSYRIAGLALLLLCVGKIVALDVWRLNPRDRYITFIVLGVALIMVSTLYSRFRGTVRKLL